ncbi:hypothetical protein N7445_005100 [Penicillium cf. griseofulvum]|nr:hypothetical protein N7445_005100 [Penicillium cf. griseofulvum]
MTTQSSISEDPTMSTMSEENERPPEYHTVPPRRAVIECIRTPNAPMPQSQAFKVNGTIYVAAQTPTLPNGRNVPGQTAAVERIFLNIEAILKAAGSSWERVIKTTVYFREDLRWKYKFEAHYQRVLPFAPPRTNVIVQRMEAKGVNSAVEIQMEVVAVE